jgi:hypothetical protein
MYIYVDVVEWSRALDVRLSEWCCSVSIKDTEASFKTKITNHGKKKNDKDEIGDILLKHAFTSL